MAAPLSKFGFLRGHRKIYIQLPQLPTLFKNTYSTESDVDFQNIPKRIRKIRNCSGLPNKKKKHGGLLGRGTVSVRGLWEQDNRAKMRRMYGVHGQASKIDPRLMFPSRGELKDLIEIDRDWTPSFSEMQQTLENQKAVEAKELRLKEERINQAMSKMPQLIAQYKQKQKNVQASDKQFEAKTEQLLDEFRERYGFSVSETSKKFKMFRILKSDELKEAKKKEKKESKKEMSVKNLEQILKVNK